MVEPHTIGQHNGIIKRLGKCPLCKIGSEIIHVKLIKVEKVDR